MECGTAVGICLITAPVVLEAETGNGNRAARRLNTYRSLESNCLFPTPRAAIGVRRFHGDILCILRHGEIRGDNVFDRRGPVQCCGRTADFLADALENGTQFTRVGRAQEVALAATGHDKNSHRICA